MWTLMSLIMEMCPGNLQIGISHMYSGKRKLEPEPAVCAVNSLMHSRCKGRWAARWGDWTSGGTDAKGAAMARQHFQGACGRCPWWAGVWCWRHSPTVGLNLCLVGGYSLSPRSPCTCHRWGRERIRFWQLQACLDIFLSNLFILQKM